MREQDEEAMKRARVFKHTNGEEEAGAVDVFCE